MRKLRSALIFFVLLALGLFVAVPAEDVSETAYDESEGVPYEGTPLIAGLMPVAAVSMALAATSAVRLLLTTPFQATAKRVNGTDTRSGEVRVVLALLCTLLC